MKTPCYISFTKITEDFTSNNFFKCVQVKKLKCVTLFSYERGKTGPLLKEKSNFASN